MQDELDALDLLGQFLMTHLRDSALALGSNLLQGKVKATPYQRVQKALQGFTPEQQVLLKDVLVTCIDGAIHDFLFALMVNGDNFLVDEADEAMNAPAPQRGHIQLLVDGEDAVSLSDNLHWGPGEEWIAKFSRFSR